MMIFLDHTKPLLERREQVRRLLEPMQRLVESEGWKLFAAYLDGELKQARNELANVKTGEQALRVAAAHTVLERLRLWPEETAKQLWDAMRELDTEAK